MVHQIGLGATSPFWVVSECESERRSCEGEGNEELPLSFPAPCFCVSFCLPLGCDFSQFPLNGELSCRLLRFSLLWEILSSTWSIMAQSILSIPMPPKAFVKCWHLLWLSTSGQRQNCSNPSVAKPVGSNHFCEINLQLSEEIAPFLKKNNLLLIWWPVLF